MTINNNNIFGAFTLGEVRSGRLTGEWLNKESVANYGWFGGGDATPGPAATVDRIDFSNDSVTASPRGSLSVARSNLAATGNSNYGWFGGGFPGPRSIVDRIDFSNDSSTASPRSPLSQARTSLAATGNSNYGWFGGGLPSLSTVDRIDFSNDSSTASPRGLLASARGLLAATGNSNYGWFGGGPSLSTVDRIDFSNDSSAASPRGPLSLARYAVRATGNSNYGWFGGGAVGLSVVTTVDRIDFSNDSVVGSLRGPLSSAGGYSGSAGNSNYGWFGGGYIPGLPGVPFATVDRVDFSNDTSTASVRGSLSVARYRLAATSGVLNIRRQKAGNFGWFGGGQGGSPIATSATVNRIDFSNDSATAVVRGPLSSARYLLTATGNSNYGWFGGGAPSPRVDRIDFSNDSATAVVRGPLSQQKYWIAATGNSNYGWFGGGIIPGFPQIIVSTVDRIDFSNDASTASVRGSLNAPTGRQQLAATGNSNYGWFGGGYIPTPATLSTVNRIDFSNDSPTASVRGPLSSARTNLAATGNSNYGWFGGGYNPSIPQRKNTVDRIDFSNDSSAALVRGPLVGIRQGLAATGNSNYGWFGGGDSPSTAVNYSVIDRIDFSNDSVSASVRGLLNFPAGSRYPAATSNTSR